MSGRIGPRVLFVCLGNICRSTMAQQVVGTELERAGVAARVDSAGLSREEAGNPLDPRAARCLRSHGYPVGSHRARQVGRDDLDAELIIAMEAGQLDELIALGADPARCHLLTDFIEGRQGTDTPDPWYGGAAEFESTFATIRAASARIVTAVREVAHR
ncbi:protein-tyrosine phosphatase [Propionibacterium cyclohexanicum]|uniref:protein-tyrosine-phosphatase n=1 Tax=Propionibacterium cyclohexanicum TaxID=64702 RepID=A0A1H9SGI4_9ACTN|nr:low molecular weight protein-tyrosine-phosphatase [Propionibacterium cyclohexanicum]SER83715.1 protein-tyrosine phosphatase [Propionibacterium cyclohexanicum]